uniref:Glycosyltransferase 2-like domain-containing protein n=1 Tax=viral metagenome TaxID=1070528 RepID=A0A6C0C3A3_9ZZZZ
MEQIIKKYVSEYNPCVCLVCHSENDSFSLSFMSSLISSKDFLNNYNIPLHIEVSNNSNNHCRNKVKNDLLAKACSIQKITHILYVNDNICWNPIDIIKLLLSNKYCVSAVIPDTTFNWDKIYNNPDIINQWKQINEIQHLNNNAEEVLQYHILDYNIGYIDNNLNLENSTGKVDFFKMGFTLLKIDMIKKLQLCFPRTKYYDEKLSKHQNNNTHFLFNSGIENNTYFNENDIFLKRWKNIGGTLWINVSINVTLTNTQYYKGSFYNSITQI